MRIFCGNLPFNLSDQELRDVFSPFGVVGEVKILTERETGRSRGFGFVEMDSDTEAITAIEELNGSDVLGRSIVVNEAKPKGSGTGSSGGGRGGEYRREARGGGRDRERGRRDDRRR